MLRQIKTIEATTNHDVKAVEYFLKEKLKMQVQGIERMDTFWT